MASTNHRNRRASGRWRRALVTLLCGALLLAIGGCGGGSGDDDPGADARPDDASTVDAGADAGADAGTDATPAADASPDAMAPRCGDGVRAASEACDDGDTEPGDGCDGACTIEHGYGCSGEPSLCVTTCGDGVRAASEACDDDDTEPGDGCDATCTIEHGYGCSGEPSLCVTTCGDGITAGSEACDDKNGVDLDGCNGSCRVDVFSEAEANDTAATANGPFSPAVRIHAQIVPAADVDHFLIVVPKASDLVVETFDDGGLGHCAAIDTTLTLVAADHTTVIATDDDSGPGRCARLVVTRLAAGSYVVRANAFAGARAIHAYDVVVRYVAACGDGAVTGSEQCDGGATCDATCARIVTCGDGHIDGSEACDDGGTAPGDGCDGGCALEVRELGEPGDTPATAAGPFTPPALLADTLSPAGDVDVVTVTLTTTTDLALETFDAAGPGSCGNLDTVLTLLAPDGATVLVERDQGGLGNCSRIEPARVTDQAARHLAPGTYFVAVRHFSATADGVAYRLLVTAAATCGDGRVSGAEECDGGAGCTAGCDRIPVCGDGLVDAPETCDDGGTAPDDGCSPSCQWLTVSETEPNGTAAQASGQAPLSPAVFGLGQITPENDVDLWSFVLTTTADLGAETFAVNGPGTCSFDSVLSLIASDGSTVLASADDGGVGNCSRLDPKLQAGVRRLAPGVYFLKVEDFGNNTVIPGYSVALRLEATCGDGLVQGSEECDGGPVCTSSCDRVAVCGDGFVDAPETCDDGGTTSGDGCSGGCAREGQVEIEPNGTIAEAQAAGLVLSPGPGTGPIAAVGLGAIGAVGDADLFPLTLTAPAIVHLELTTAQAACTTATTLTLFDGGGAVLYTDDNSGIGTCSALTVPLPAGTVYAQVRQRGDTAAIPSYVLTARAIASPALDVLEVEPNDTGAAAQALTGTDLVVRGALATASDRDVFTLTLPVGRSLRLELVEADPSTTCESGALDSFVGLYDPSGALLVEDDDAGRGLCSLIDGSGDVPGPANPAAHALPAGVYTITVEAAPFAQQQGSPSAVFAYRLVISLD